MKNDVWGNEGIDPDILKLEGEWSASRHGRLTPGRKSTGGWELWIGDKFDFCGTSNRHSCIVHYLENPKYVCAIPVVFLSHSDPDLGSSIEVVS